MTRPKDQDRTKAPAKKPASRDARLAAALRENLRRRKAQERGRGVEAPDKQGREPGSGRDR